MNIFGVKKKSKKPQRLLCNCGSSGSVWEHLLADSGAVAVTFEVEKQLSKTLRGISRTLMKLAHCIPEPTMGDRTC